MPMFYSQVGFGVISGDNAASAVWTDSAIDVTAATTFNFSAKAFSFSTAAAGRQIVVAINAPRVGGTGGTISSVTIGGVAASLVVGINNTSDGNTSRTEMWVATVPSGTTGTISVTVNSGGAARVTVYALYNASTSVPTGTAIGSSTASNGTDTLDIVANGVAIAASIDAIGTTSTAWTGLTEDLDTVLSSGGVTSASAEFATAQSGLTITATNTAPAVPAFVCAAWPPL